MRAPSTTSSFAWTGRSSPPSSSRGPRTTVISGETRAAVGSPPDAARDKNKVSAHDAHSMSDADVDALAKEAVDWYVEWNPIFATYVGIHAHDHRLPIGTYDAELEERARVKEFLRRVEAIDRTGLSAGKRVDLGNLRNVFRTWIFESEEIGTWQPMPRGAQTVGDALFPLLMRSFAPLPRRLESITGRLERSPGFLEETKGRIRTQ